MKNLFLASLTALSVGAGAQTIQLKNADNNTIVAPNSTLAVASVIDDNVKITFDIKNISANTQTYTAKRYDVLLNTDAASSTTATAYFCFGGNCYGPSTFVSPNDLILSANQSASEVQGQWQMLIADLDEASVLGLSLVRYTFANVNTPADSIQVTVQYNGVTSNAINNTYSFGGVTASSGTVDPSPLVNIAGVSFGPFTSVGNSANPSGSNAFSFSGWPLGATNGSDTPASMTGQINTGNYYGITVSPAPGYFTSLTGISFDVDRSASGSRNYAVRSSADSYVANLSASVAANANLSVLSGNTFLWNLDATFNAAQSGSEIDLSAAAFKNFTSPITFRFYSWNAEDAGGTFGIDNVVLKGLTSLYMTGIGKLSYDLNAKFKLYPNPSSINLVTLESDKEFSSVQIINAMGSLVKDQAVNGFDGKVNIDLTDMAEGVYYVKIIKGNTFSTEKLIISK